MGFFKDLKNDLAQAVNELSDEATKVADTSMDDVMVDTLTEEDDLALKAALENVSEQPVVEVEEETAEEVVEEKVEEKVEEPVVEAKVEEAPKATARPASDETTIITPGLKITGDIKSEGSVELLGSVEGNVECKGKLVVSGKITGNTSSAEFFADKADIKGDVQSTGSAKIGSGSVIIGNLKATSAVIAGAIKGDIDVQGPVIVDTSAIVLGNIKSKLVQINNGAVIEGHVSQCYSDNSPKKFFGEK